MASILSCLYELGVCATASIKDEFYFFGGFYTGGSMEVLVGIYQNGVLLPITFKLDDQVISKILGGTAFAAKKHAPILLGRKIKEYFIP